MGDKKKADEMPRESMHEASVEDYVKLFKIWAVSMEKKLESGMEQVEFTKRMFFLNFWIFQQGMWVKHSMITEEDPILCQKGIQQKEEASQSRFS